MRKLFFVLLLALAFIPFRSVANVNIFISDETLWTEFIYFYNMLKEECPAGTAPNNFSVFGTGNNIFIAEGSLTCDNCIEGDCEYGQPWSGRYNGGAGTSAPPPPSPLEPSPSSGDSLAQLSDSYYDPDSRGFEIDGNIRGALGTNVFGNWDIQSGDRRAWRPVSDFSHHGNVLEDPWAFNYFMELNIKDQTDTLIDAVGISTNLTARRIAHMAEMIERSSAHNDLLHAFTVSSSAAYSAEAADYVVSELSNEFMALNSAIDGIDVDTSGLVDDIYDSQKFLHWDTQDAVWDATFINSNNVIDTLGVQLGSQMGAFQSSLSSNLSSNFSTVNSNIQNLNSQISAVTTNVNSRHGEVMGTIGSNHGDVMTALYGDLLPAINSSGGSGGGISEEFASGLVGDYTGDDYDDSEAEGLLGTEGLTIDDLEGETVSLDSLSENFFSFAPAQCFEPLTINFTVFGAENIVEIDLTPLCTLFSLVGALLFIASNLLALRTVVGAF